MRVFNYSLASYQLDEDLWQRLQGCLENCQRSLSPKTRERYKALFCSEHLAILAKRLLYLALEGPPERFPPPYFFAEITPDWQTVFAPFAPVMRQWLKQGDMATEWARTLEQVSCQSILILLGQRLTPASITDERAIPPLQADLLATAQIQNNQGHSVAARALDKHTHRSPDSFWGASKGSPAEKNAHAIKIVTEILIHKTWWNIFYHYQHELVYEARVSSGHGVRWANFGEKFIGFLEPFLNPPEQSPDHGAPAGRT